MHRFTNTGYLGRARLLRLYGGSPQFSMGKFGDFLGGVLGFLASPTPRGLLDFFPSPRQIMDDEKKKYYCFQCVGLKFTRCRNQMSVLRRHCAQYA